MTFLWFEPGKFQKQGYNLTDTPVRSEFLLLREWTDMQVIAVIWSDVVWKIIHFSF
jgi:hypothetical protein